MSKVAEVTPMDIKFQNKEQEQKFIDWANDRSTADQQRMVEMREKIRQARKIKSRIDQQ
ncbi:hypothetical protein [Gracilibacillus phocaeensis]|uniref:hypothetical protein n=1 Tax=Gracilibacillus phocaeensis TaxID=2042304 RepID=UPI0013EF472B|nr:hypothetical protein [Gracilibacillus phocaeensis]